MKYEILFSGLGGQGIVLAGKIIAEAAIQTGHNVSCFPAYGPEMRGGRACCHLVISDEEIGNVIVENPDILVCLDHTSKAQYTKTIKEGGKLLLTTDVSDDVSESLDLKQWSIPASEILHSLAMDKEVNMVMLGALMQCIGCIEKKTVEESVARQMATFSAEAINRNIQAVHEGIKAVLPITNQL